MVRRETGKNERVNHEKSTSSDRSSDHGRCIDGFRVLRAVQACVPGQCVQAVSGHHLSAGVLLPADLHTEADLPAAVPAMSGAFVPLLKAVTDAPG